MSEFSNTPDQLAALAELDQLLAANRVAYWLFGGWAVDFHAGRVTREHGDIDIAVWLHDRARLAVLLADRAWTHRPEAGEDGSTCYERRGVRLEVAFLARDERGGFYTPLQGGRGEWPANSFGDDVARLRGVSACVVGRAALIADKSVVREGTATAAKDRADVASLTSRRIRLSLRASNTERVLPAVDESHLLSLQLTLDAHGIPYRAHRDHVEGVIKYAYSISVAAADYDRAVMLAGEVRVTPLEGGAWNDRRFRRFVVVAIVLVCILGFLMVGTR
jgi:hypothetical protein